MTPHALTREQVEHICQHAVIDGHYSTRVSAAHVIRDHDAALRATIAQQAQEIERLRTGQGISSAEMGLSKQLAAMTAERDNYLSKWRASADLNKGLLRDYDTSQARVRELEERLIASEKAAYDVAGVIDHLKATLAEREAEVGELNVQLRDARQDAARLREALQAHMQLAAKICYAEPELSQYRAMTKQAQKALKGA